MSIHVHSKKITPLTPYKKGDPELLKTLQAQSTRGQKATRTEVRQWVAELREKYYSEAGLEVDYVSRF